jgi:hypothetical protein
MIVGGMRIRKKKCGNFVLNNFGESSGSGSTPETISLGQDPIHFGLKLNLTEGVLGSPIAGG